MTKYRVFLIVVILCATLSPQPAKALLSLPLAHLQIVANVPGPEQQLSFHVAVPDSSAPLKDFAIQTDKLTGHYDINLEAWPSDYILSQDLPPGITVSDFSCQTTGNSAITPVGDTVSFHLVAGDNITCTYNYQANIGKHPVLIIPGVGATELAEGPDLLWLNLPRIVLPLASDIFLAVLGFKPDLSPLNSDIEVRDVIRRKQIAGTSIDLYNYTDGLIKAFENQGYKDGQDLFLFPYDWRFGVSADNIQKLKSLISAISARNNDLSVDVVAHSTGGLLLKEYARANTSKPNIRRAVMVGVPHLGAPKALKMLLQGDNFGVPGLDEHIMQNVAHNMPVVYELAPTIGYYINQGWFYQVSNKNLDYIQTRNRLLTDKQLNAVAWQRAENLHTKESDNFDLRTAGIDAYNIVGCGSGTLGRIIEKRQSVVVGSIPAGYKVEYVSGDGTVPMTSAASTPTDAQKIYYNPKVKHGTMMTDSTVSREITEIIATDKFESSATSTKDCALNGHTLSIFSPLTIMATDSLGNKAGMTPEGDSYNDIPGSEFMTMGDHKFLYLPDDGANYNIALTGTGEGTFTLLDELIQDNKIADSKYYYNVPVTSQWSGQLILGANEAIKFQNKKGSEATIRPEQQRAEEAEKDSIIPIPTSIQNSSIGSGEWFLDSVKRFLGRARDIIITKISRK